METQFLTTVQLVFITSTIEVSAPIMSTKAWPFNEQN